MLDKSSTPSRLYARSRAPTDPPHPFSNGSWLQEDRPSCGLSQCACRQTRRGIEIRHPALGPEDPIAEQKTTRTQSSLGSEFAPASGEVHSRVLSPTRRSLPWPRGASRVLSSCARGSAPGVNKASSSSRSISDDHPTYNFCRVPESVFNAFLRSSSKGAYYNDHIRDRYQC